MYIISDMIDMGLKDKQKWPTDTHRIVAQYVLLCNSNIRSKDALIDGVQAIIAIPKEKIKTVTTTDLVKKYGFQANLFT